jgi:hypothetical protein
MHLSNRARIFIVAGFMLAVIVGTSAIALRPKYQRRSELNPAELRWRRSLIGQAFAAAEKIASESRQERRGEWAMI